MEHVITERIRTNFLDDRGVAVDGYRVYFVMADGVVDYVEIKKSQYNVDNVKKAIEKTISTHLEVASG